MKKQLDLFLLAFNFPLMYLYSTFLNIDFPDNEIKQTEIAKNIYENRDALTLISLYFYILIS